MALSAAAILPHSPLLIPDIGRANFDFLAKTSAAYQEIAARLKKSETEVVIIISPHGSTLPDSFTLNIAPEMLMDFKQFGFIPPRTALAGDALLADRIKDAARPDFPVALASEADLDYGSAIPLYLLKNLLGEFKVIVVSPAGELDRGAHFRFGRRLGEIIKTSEKKIAVIASADLSHRLKRKSPGGYSPKGAKFDNKLIEYLNEPGTANENILKMDDNLIKDAGECGLKPIIILLGALTGTAWQPRVLAYQTDFGIGYLSLSFDF